MPVKVDREIGIETPSPQALLPAGIERRRSRARWGRRGNRAARSRRSNGRRFGARSGRDATRALIERIRERRIRLHVGLER
jgi:hypothetical protein